MKIGRNDPCPCGSGKKHKQCCLKQQFPAHSSADMVWRRIRRELETQPERLLRFIDEAYGPVAVVEAWLEFMLWDEDAPDLDPDSVHFPVFMPWFFHCWAPNPMDTNVLDEGLHGIEPTRAFLNRKGRHLLPVMREYLESCVRRPFSFFEVEQFVPGYSTTLRDLLIGDRFEVREQSASQYVEPHSVVYCQIASAGGVNMLEATGPVALRPGDKIPIIALREHLTEDIDEDGTAAPSGIELLQVWEIELRELYLELTERALYPIMPELRTSDDEVWEFHKLVFDIDSAQLAWEALRHLGHDLEDSEAGISRNGDGEVERASIDWLKQSEGDVDSCTVLGKIRIHGKRLIAEVHSRERAARLKEIVAEKLGDHATFRADEVQALAQAMENPVSPPRTELPEQDHPAVQEAIAAHLRQHYTQWIDEQIPALNGRTPREAMTTAPGREQVEALLQGAERLEMGLPQAVNKEVFDSIRAQLGLLA